MQGTSVRVAVLSCVVKEDWEQLYVVLKQCDVHSTTAGFAKTFFSYAAHMKMCKLNALTFFFHRLFVLQNQKSQKPSEEILS